MGFHKAITDTNLSESEPKLQASDKQYGEMDSALVTLCCVLFYELLPVRPLERAMNYFL